MSRRTERLASTIKHELMSIIQRELADPRITGMPSITRVEITDDLATADVFLTIMGTPAQQTLTLNALKHSAGMMRTKLTKALYIRQVPYLQFQIDENLKKELAMLELLEKVAEENRELDRKRAAQLSPQDPPQQAGLTQEPASPQESSEQRDPVSPRPPTPPPPPPEEPTTP